MAKILEASPKLDRASVMEAARTLKGISGAGLELPGATWDTSKTDWFLGETFQLVKYDKAAGHTVAIGSIIEPRRQDRGPVAEDVVEQLAGELATGRPARRVG